MYSNCSLIIYSLQVYSDTQKSNDHATYVIVNICSSNIDAAETNVSTNSNNDNFIATNIDRTASKAQKFMEKR